MVLFPRRKESDTELPGFDQYEYTCYSGANRRTLDDLLDELATVRAATLSFFNRIGDDALTRAGVANGNLMSVRAIAHHIAGHEFARATKEKAMPMFELLNPNYEEQLRQGFASQSVMETIGAYLLNVAPGQVEIGLDFSADLTQQHGYLHAGIVTAIVDSACGFAAYSLMPPGSGVLTVEYKVNLLAPARGEKFIATGRVIKPGRTLTVCAGEVYAIEGEARRQIAMMQATMIRLAEKEA